MKSRKKIKMKSKLSICIILLIFNTALQAQKSNFDIMVKNKTVGEATITKKNISDTEYSIKYTFDASITILFITTTVDMDILMSYKNNQLVEGNVNYLYNNKRTITKYKWNGSSYDVDQDGKKSRLNEKVLFSTMNLYEKEPLGVKKIFLENQNEFTEIKNLGNNTYFAKVDGDDCTYTYKNAELQKILIDAFVNITIIRKN